MLISVFSSHAGKYGPENVRLRSLFMQCQHFTAKAWDIFTTWLYDDKLYIIQRRIQNPTKHLRFRFTNKFDKLPHSKKTLCGKCSNAGFFFLVCILPYSDLIRRFTEHISVFSPKKEKKRTGKNYVFGHFSCSGPRELQGRKTVKNDFIMDVS